MNFNADGTIQPITVNKKGVGALRPDVERSPNLALSAHATASSIRPNYHVALHSKQGLERVETYAPTNAIDGYNGTRWMAASDDQNAWLQVDLGAPREIHRTEAYFVRPAAGHAYKLEYSLDGKSWKTYGEHDQVVICSPHRDAKPVRARYLKLTILKGIPGLWEFRVY